MCRLRVLLKYLLRGKSTPIGGKTGLLEKGREPGTAREQLRISGQYVLIMRYAEDIRKYSLEIQV